MAGHENLDPLEHPALLSLAVPANLKDELARADSKSTAARLHSLLDVSGYEPEGYRLFRVDGAVRPIDTLITSASIPEADGQERILPRVIVTTYGLDSSPGHREVNPTGLMRRVHDYVLDPEGQPGKNVALYVSREQNTVVNQGRASTPPVVCLLPEKRNLFVTYGAEYEAFLRLTAGAMLNSVMSDVYGRAIESNFFTRMAHRTGQHQLMELSRPPEVFTNPSRH
jgi:hypothetical protein